MHKFCKNHFRNYLHTNRQKKFAHFLFVLVTQKFKLLQTFLHIRNDMVKGFSKMCTLSFFDILILQTFLLYNWICKKDCKFANFLQILIVKHKSFPMIYHLSYLNIKHGIYSGGSIWTPPPSVSWFWSTPAGIGFRLDLLIMKIFLASDFFPGSILGINKTNWQTKKFALFFYSPFLGP